VVRFHKYAKMIQPRSLVKIVDNSGAKVCRVIKVLSQTPKTKVGDLAVVSLQKVRPRKIHKGKKGEGVKKGEIRLALLIHLKSFVDRKDGTSFKMNDNYGILVTSKGKTLGTRFKLPLPKELRTQKWIKVVSMASSFF
jgi:large subunit ribosomal protein L14